MEEEEDYQESENSEDSEDNKEQKKSNDENNSEDQNFGFHRSVATKKGLKKLPTKELCYLNVSI